MSHLQARGLAGGYARGDIVRDVDLELVGGECLAVLGPNGAGKTTLLRLLAGILPATAGEVLLDGVPLGSRPRRQVARTVGLVPQGVSFAFPLSVREAVEQGRAPHLGPWRPLSPHDHAAVDAALAAFGIAGLATRPVKELSGGERQLVLLARALAAQPRLLLLDEPAVSLDVRHQLELVDRLGELRAAGIGVLVVIHDVNLALRVATRIAILSRGEILRIGPPEEVVEDAAFADAFGVRTSLVRLPDGSALAAYSSAPPRN
jgi:iron complex transport system ATP-binding protein